MTFTFRSFYLPPDLLLNFKRPICMQKSLCCSGSRTQEQEKWMNCHFQREKKPLKKTVEMSFQVTCISLCVCVCECVYVCVCVHAQSCLTLCNPVGCSPSASSVHGIFQARIMEWVAFSYSRGSSEPRDWTLSSGISCVSCSSCIAGRFFTGWPTSDIPNLLELGC